MSGLTKVELEVESAKHILMSMGNDIEQLERYWPASKRGANAQRALDGIKERRAVAMQCMLDAEDSMTVKP